MVGFVDALDEEIDSLEMDLLSDPRYIKLQELKRVRALYSATLRSARLPAVPRHRSRVNPDRERTLDAAATIIQGRTRPTTTAAILERVQTEGITVPGKDARNTLSAMLSHSDRFESHGRSGWTLVEPDEPDHSEEAADGDLLEGNPSTASESRPSDQRASNESHALGGGT